MDTQALIEPIYRLLQDSFRVSWTLFRVMIPTLLVIKLTEELGGITYLSQLLEPLMSAVAVNWSKNSVLFSK